MAQVDIGHEGEGIKLFGTRITLHGRQRNEDKKSSELEGTEEKRPADKTIQCPRCKSMETKFCYFNNYNVNQPRHFCKACLRYWTAGGSLRNVPVGSGRRKAKQPCRDDGGLPDGDLYEASTVQQFGLDEWHVSTMVHGGFRQLFPSKRRRSSSGGQPC